jgi:hypothetical protein
MAFADNLYNNFVTLGNTYGTTVLIQLKSRSYSGADYDIEILANSGNLLSVSGIVLPLGKDERQYVEQGLLDSNDKKLFLPSGAEINESADLVFSSGSWTVMPKGVSNYETAGQVVYHRVLVRRKI